MYFKNLISICLFCFTPSLVFAEKPIGEEDASVESHLLFLKDTTVLLQKGDARFGVAFSMTNDEQRILTTSYSQRVFSLALSYSLGVGYGAEVFASIPVSYTNTQKYDFMFEVNEKKTSGFNNAILGVKKTLLVQNADRPELVGTLSFSSPMESESELYPKDTAMTAELTTIMSIDPVVLYTGISYMHPFGNASNSFGFRFGSAFAVNHKIAFGGELSMSKMSNEDTTLSPISTLTIRETYSASKKFSIEPSLSFGLSDNAPDTTFRLSASWSY